MALCLHYFTTALVLFFAAWCMLSNSYFCTLLDTFADHKPVDRNTMSNLYGAADDTGASRGLSDFALQLRSVDVKTWEQFYVSIAGTHPIIDEDVVEENTEKLKAARFRTDDR